MNSQLKRSNGVRNLYKNKIKNKKWILIASIGSLFILLILLLLYFSGVFSSSPKPTLSESESTPTPGIVSPDVDAGENIENGDKCETGNESDCKSKNCDCPFGSYSGDTCVCVPGTGDETKIVNDKNCIDDEQCASGYCKDSVCTELTENGEKCSDSGDDDDCESGSCGQYADDDYRCCSKSGLLGTVSDWCLDLKTGDDCDKDSQCTSGWCSGGKCKAKAKVGEKCGASGDDDTCESGSCGQHADDDYRCCSKSGLLGTVSDWCLDLKTGDDCDKDSQCTSGWCSGGKCKAKAKVGEKCGASGDDDTCESGSCGQHADDDYRCCSKSGLLGTVSDWCLDLKTGDDCDKDSQCTSGWCSGGKCKAKLKSQQKCTSNGQCYNNKCGRNKAGTDDLVCCAGGMSAYAGYDYCTGRPKGTVCWADKHCTSGNCSGNWSGLKKGTCD